MRRRTMLHGIGAGAAGTGLLFGSGQARAGRTDSDSDSESESATVTGSVVISANPGRVNAAVGDGPGKGADAARTNPARGNAAAESVPGAGIGGATVRAIDADGAELDIGETDDDGGFSLDVAGADPSDVRIVLVVDGSVELAEQRVYAAAERVLDNARETADFTITAGELETDVEVDGETVAVAYGIVEDAQTDGAHVGTVEQLQAIETGEGISFDDEYRLVADVDASATADWNDGKGFEPIGSDRELGGVDEDGTPNEPDVGDDPFTGTFDGDGYEIAGLFIDRTRNQVGLFGAATEARISGVALRDVEVTGLTDTGALIGKLFGGSVEDSSVINGDVRTDGAVLLERRDEIEFDAFVGGLIGEVDGGVEDGLSEPAVVTGCEAAVDVEEGEEPAAEGAAVGQAGGLVGQLRNGARLEDSVARGDVVGVTSDIGGLVGEVDASFGNETTVEGCTAYGDVSTAVGDAVSVDRDVEEYGGLVGENDDGGIIVECEAHGDVDTTGASESEETGGLVGQHNQGGVIEDSFATGDVAGDEEVGGLVGENDDGDETGGLIRRSYATGTVTGNEGVGGLVGENDANAEIQDSFATGTVTGIEEVGGLVGENDDDGAIVRSFAAATVDGREEVGGLVGENNAGATIDRSYALSTVHGDEAVGGLVGENESGGAVTESYAAGSVDGNADVGGAVGLNDGVVDTTYWDRSTTGQSRSDGSPDENGLDTDAMQGGDLNENLAVDFDFERTWQTVVADDADRSEDGYPILQALDRGTQLDAQNGSER